VARAVDVRIRAQLLGSIVDHVVDRGLADLSLRPLAIAIGSSPRTLLYHFTSKERLLVAVLLEIGRRQARLLDAWYERSAEYDTRTLLLRAWQWLTAPRNDRLLRLLFEAYGIALRDRRRYGAFLRATTTDWQTPFERILETRGFTPERAAALVHLLVATMRGLLLDVLATGDRARAERAFRSFLSAIELPEARPSV
jgi:AcrR family transcriptional regulator